MSGKNNIFDDKKTTGVIFMKRKKMFNIYDVMLINHEFSKKNIMLKEAHFNAFFDITTMTSLDLYV